MTSQQQPRDARNVIILGGVAYALEDDRSAADVVEMIRSGEPGELAASTPLPHHPGAVLEGTLTIDPALPGGHTFTGSQIAYGHTWP